ncbi:hypothetical protein PTKIN_Ptkin03bG0013900 [Pterospermum kingtungense]
MFGHNEKTCPKVTPDKQVWVPKQQTASVANDEPIVSGTIKGKSATPIQSVNGLLTQINQEKLNALETLNFVSKVGSPLNDDDLMIQDKLDQKNATKSPVMMAPMVVSSEKSKGLESSNKFASLAGLDDGLEDPVENYDVDFPVYSSPKKTRLAAIGAKKVLQQVHP